MAKLVDKGNTISFPKDELDGSSITIEWKQNISSKKADFVLVSAFIDDDTTSAFPLFIQKTWIDRFQGKCKTSEDGKKCTVVVDSDFQYGQDKDKTMRFLVYQDKSNKQFQHRFINSTIASKFASLVKKVAGSVDSVPYVGTMNKLVGLGQGIFGDPLRDF
jgi:hypothetical protein